MEMMYNFDADALHSRLMQCCKILTTPGKFYLIKSSIGNTFLPIYGQLDTHHL